MVSALKQPGLAIFVKTPGHSTLKTRLAATIGREAAQEFHLLSAKAVAAVASLAGLDADGCIPYWAVAEPSAMHDAHWSSLPRLAQGDGALGKRMARISTALCKNHGGALLLGADNPQIQANDLTTAVRTLRSHAHVLGPSHDGGFWLFGTRGDVPNTAWTATPWSQNDTAARFRTALGDVSVAYLRTLRDVDRAVDLPALLDALEALPDPVPEQIQLAEWLRTRPV